MVKRNDAAGETQTIRHGDRDDDTLNGRNTKGPAAGYAAGPAFFLRAAMEHLRLVEGCVVRYHPAGYAAVWLDPEEVLVVKPALNDSWTFINSSPHSYVVFRHGATLTFKGTLADVYERLKGS